MPLQPDPYARNFSIKSEIGRVLGLNAWYALKETTNTAVWKKYFEKVLKSYLAAAKATVTVADDHWHKEFEENIKDAIKRVRGANDFDCALDVFCAALIRQSYLQLGLVLKRGPSSMEEVRLVPGSWRLNSFRTVQYVQTREQRDRHFWSWLQAQIGVEAQMQAWGEYRRSKSDLSFEDWYYANRKADDGEAKE